MNRALLKIKAVLLSLLLLLASNTYAITSHFCGSFLVDVSLVGNVASCSMDVSGDDCDSEVNFSQNCCKDVVQVIDYELDSSTPKYQKNLIEKNVVFLFLSSYLAIYPEQDLEKPPLKDTPPPDSERDFQVLFQTFLI